MEDEDLFKKAQGLGDLELAFLLSLMGREHCIISTHPAALDDLIQELQLISSRTFGLTSAVIDCGPTTTLDDFVSSLLLSSHPPGPPSRTPSPFLSRSESYFHNRARVAPLSPITLPASPSTAASTAGPTAAPLFSIAEVVLAKNLDRAPRMVQIQALELLRTRRIFTRTAVQTAPKTFLLVPVLGATSGGRARVARHLNDAFAVSHWHDAREGFACLEEGYDGEDAETASTESVVKRSVCGEKPDRAPVLTAADISRLAQLSQGVNMDVDVLRYQMNIVSFLRIHRAVSAGVTPTATKHFDKLVRCLAPLHSIDYVTPALVGLAARRIYTHRIEIASPAEERSLQWGSSPRAVEALLEGVGPEDVLEDVLSMVTAPL